MNRVRQRSPSFENLLAGIRSIGRVGLVGGAVRDWYFGRQPRDLDLAIDCDAEALHRLLAPQSSERTRFGGYRWRTTGLQVDLWALSQTWAFRAASTWHPSYEALPRTTFFNLDAAVVTLDSWELFEHRFVESLNTRILRINFKENPRPDMCAVRALVLSHRFGFEPDVELHAFLSQMFASGLDWNRFNSLQISHYGGIIIGPSLFERCRRSSGTKAGS